jgi:hypothetical protein
METTTATRPVVGDERSYAGVTFKATEELLTFDKKPRGVRWRAGLDVAVDEHCLGGADHPFLARNIHCRTFEKAAQRAIAGRVRDIRQAAALIDAYHAEPQEYREALENAAA